MTLPSLFRRHRAPAVTSRHEDHPFLAFQRDVNRMVEDLWRGFDVPTVFGEGWESFSPRVDVEETANEIAVTAELPGLEEKDFELSVVDDALVLKGEKRAEREDRERGWQERSYGSFERVIPLPSEIDADKASAQFKHGVLRVRLPKSAKAQERTKHVPVSTA